MIPSPLHRPDRGFTLVELTVTLGITALAEPATAPAVARNGEPLLEIEDLNVQFVTSHWTVRDVEGLSYTPTAEFRIARVGKSYETSFQDLGVEYYEYVV